MDLSSLECDKSEIDVALKCFIHRDNVHICLAVLRGRNLSVKMMSISGKK